MGSGLIMKKPNAKHTPKRKPRDVRGAIRQGWHPITVSTAGKDVSYLGLQIYCDCTMTGRWVSQFGAEHKFVFERESDASVFALRWS